jgi:hypothetical protein
MGDNHRLRWWPIRLFTVVDDSMRPTLGPGDGLFAVRVGGVRPGQVRVFRDPRRSSRWLVKRVGEVYTSGRTTIFEARSDNPSAPGAVDAHDFGWVSVADSYRVVFTARRRIAR